jgi:hypothetical protein
MTIFPVKHFTKETMDAYILKYSTHSVEKAPPLSDLPCHVLAFHALYENMLEFVMPLCSQLPRPYRESPVFASTHIIDITDVSLGHLWKIKSYLQAAISTATTNYPETLGHIFVRLSCSMICLRWKLTLTCPFQVVGAPPSFVRAWGMIKRWFDPSSVSKILILSPSETNVTLLNFIDSQNLPKQYGGALCWAWGDMPNLEQSAREIAPELYRKDENGDEQYLKGPGHIEWTTSRTSKE